MSTLIEFGQLREQAQCWRNDSLLLRSGRGVTNKTTDYSRAQDCLCQERAISEEVIVAGKDLE